MNQEIEANRKGDKRSEKGVKVRKTYSRIRSAAIAMLTMLMVGALTTGCPLVFGFGATGSGLVITVLGVTVGTDGRPVVTFTATDERGDAIALEELTDARFILAQLDPGGNGDTSRYVSYTTRIDDPDRTPNTGDEEIQATYDSGGIAAVIQNPDGTFQYTFAAALPAGFSRTASHQLGGQFRRVSRLTTELFKANVAFPFCFDGSEAETREIVETATCNECHGRLSIHGDIRREVQLCILCHTPQSKDAQTENELDFAQMVHKIHSGAELPSVEGGTPYRIVGFNNSVHDYSTVEFPPPQDVRNCEVCHGGAEKSNFYLLNPTQEGCGSCHDRTWFNTALPTPEGFTDHPFEETDNSNCATCHTPTEPGVAPIIPAHLLPNETKEALGLALDITAVRILNADTTPQLQIDFTAVDGKGAPLTSLAGMSVNANIGWPTSDYQFNNRNVIQGNGASGTLVNNGGGSYTYTFSDAADTLPLGSTDTFAVAMEGRRPFTHDGVTYNQGTETNGLTYFTLDGSEPVLRREIVDEEACEKCHSEIRLHGENRTGVEYCLFCHRPNNTDAARRPADQMPPETVNFKQLIHKIHMGENLTGEYTVYGFGNTPHDYTEIRFPGSANNCEVCHFEGTYELPIAEGAQPTVINQGEVLISETLPERAACTACHDDPLTDAHTLAMTVSTTETESCAVCHGAGAPFDVELVHALTP